VPPRRLQAVRCIAATGPAACAELEAWGALPELVDMLAFGVTLTTLDSSGFVADACNALLALLERGGGGVLERAAAAGALVPLAAVLSHPLADVNSWAASGMVNASLFALFKLVAGSRERAEWLASQGALSSLIQALRHPDTGVAAAAATIIGVMAEAVQGDTDDPPPVAPALVRRLLSGGVLPALIALLRRRPPLIRRPGTGPGQALQPPDAAVAALRQLARASPGLHRQIVTHAGALTGLSQVLDPGCDGGDASNLHAAAIIVAAAADVGNDDVLASALAASAVVPSMLNLLRPPPKASSSELIVLVLMALEAFVGHRRLHRVIQRAGGAMRLKGLQKHPAAQIRDAAAQIANNYISRSPAVSP
jgi:hypothetical protein